MTLPIYHSARRMQSGCAAVRRALVTGGAEDTVCVACHEGWGQAGGAGGSHGARHEALLSQLSKAAERCPVHSRGIVGLCSRSTLVMGAPCGPGFVIFAHPNAVMRILVPLQLRRFGVARVTWARHHFGL